MFKSYGTLRKTLMRVKNARPELKLKEVVYEVPCKDCECSYIGETGRNLQKHLTEHKAAVKRGDRNNWIAVHAWDHDHRVDWEALSQSTEAGTSILEEMDTRSNPHNETREYH